MGEATCASLLSRSLPRDRLVLSSAASLAGTVVDSSGAAMPQARLMVVSRTLGTRWNTLATPPGNSASIRFPRVITRSKHRPRGFRWPARSAVSLRTKIRADSWCSRPHGSAAKSTSRLPLRRYLPMKSHVPSTRSRDTISQARNEYSLSEAIQSVAGMRVQSLGGPGSFTRILMRGLRAQDTSIAVDGLRFRDAGTTKVTPHPSLKI